MEGNWHLSTEFDQSVMKHYSLYYQAKNNISFSNNFNRLPSILEVLYAAAVPGKPWI